MRKSYFVILVLIASAAVAAPDTIRFQGRLTDAQGRPRVGNAVRVQFSLYATSSGGAALWQGPANQTVGTNDAGLFSTDIGPLPSAVVTANEDLYLQIAVHDGANWRNLTPRQKLASVPYAMRSDYAVSAGTAQKISPDAVGTTEIRDMSITTVDLSPALQQNLVPAGAIIMFAGSCPTGWSFFAPLSGHIPIGINEFEYTGVQAGTWTITGSSIAMSGEHRHAVDAHTHSISHKHTLPLGYPPGENYPNHVVSWWAWTEGIEETSTPVTHFSVPSQSVPPVTVNLFKSRTSDTPNSGAAAPGTDIQGRHTHAISHAGQWRPPHVGVVFCQKD